MRRVRQRHQGFSVAAMFAMAILCLVLALTVAGIATYQLNAAKHTQNAQQALYLAEGAMSKTMDAMHSAFQTNAFFGEAGETVYFTPDPSNPQNQGMVSFSSAVAPWGWSTTNADPAHPSPTGWAPNGGSTPLKSGQTLVVAKGTCGTATRMLEAIVVIPPFQYVLAVDGALVCPGKLDVEGAQSMGTLVAAGGAPDPSVPANAASGVSIGGGAGSLISGDAVLPNPGALSSSITVDGSVLAENPTLPNINISTYSTAVFGHPLPPPASIGGAGDETINFDTYHNGPVHVTGNLIINRATLYIDGSLQVDGGIIGTGAVCTNGGSITVGGAANLSAANMVALLSSGGVSFTGSSSSTVYFQGLVYTTGPFSANNITIAGVFVANGQAGGGAPATLTLLGNTHVIYIASAATIAPPPPVGACAIDPGGHACKFGDPTLPATCCVGPPPGKSCPPPRRIPCSYGWFPATVCSSSNCQLLWNAYLCAVHNCPILCNWANSPMWPPSTFCVVGCTAHGHPCCNSTISQGWSFMGFFRSWSYRPSAAHPSASMCVIAYAYDPSVNRFVKVCPPIVKYEMNTSTHCRYYTCKASYDAAVTGQGLPNSCQMIAAFTNLQKAFAAAANGLLAPCASKCCYTPCRPNLPNLTLSQFFSSDTPPIQVVSWREIQ